MFTVESERVNPRMQIVAFIIMSFAATTTRCYNLPRRIPSSFISTGRRSFTVDATKFTTADLQGKLFTPVNDGFDLMAIGIGTC